MIDYLEAENLKAFSGIRHGFFTRNGGVSEGVYASLHCGLSSADSIEHVLENRRRVAEALAVAPTHLLSCSQIHSAKVITVTDVWKPEDRPAADAMVTNLPNIAIGALSADCVPVLFADSKARIIGAAHAGWRGAIGGVIENTLKAMETLGANRNTIDVAIGPCIWQNSYEVGAEFPAPFLAEDPAHQKFFRPAFRSDHYMFDLPGYVTAKLRALKVGSVEPSPADTCADASRFFSYRRNCLAGEKKVGSLIAAIVLGE